MWHFKLVIFYLCILILSLFYISPFWKFCMSSLNGWKIWILKDPHFGATNFLSNFIFLSYLLVYPKIVICLAYTSKKYKFWHPYLRGTPIVVLPNFVKFYLFIFTDSILKNFISPAWVVQFWFLASLFEGNTFILVLPNFVKFIFILSILKISSVQRKWLNLEFWRPCLKRIPSFWYPQILSNFIFSWYLPILKISCVWLEWLEFWWPRLRSTPILVPPNFTKLYFSFIFTYPKNFMYLV